MSGYPFDERSEWYHGSPLVLTELAVGSTITQWKALAQAFSHKPDELEYDQIFVNILHNGKLFGYLYTVDEPISMYTDIHPHPRTSMDEGVEWITDRALKLRLTSEESL